jgi:hypothetical protein
MRRNSFLNRCGQCGKAPRAYKCFHCGEILFFDNERVSANCAHSTSGSAKEATVAANEKQQQEQEQARQKRNWETELKREEIQYEIELNKLLLLRTEAITQLRLAEKKHSQIVGERTNRSQYEELKEDEAKDGDRHTALDRVFTEGMEEIEKKWKHSPDMLEREKERLKLWREKHLF